jgi:L-threonylcarbamoyladenylate synthase
MGTRRRRVSVIYFISKRDKWDNLRMEFISNCTADAISNAAKALKDGHLVAFPTETVYGLGADATNEKAVSRIYSVKGRPANHPIIVHISSINKLEDWATDIPDYAIKLAREFWPGPMTLILPRKEIVRDFITGGQNYVGLRVPAQPLALALLHRYEDFGGQGIAAPSANRFGAVSPTKAKDVEEELGNYLDPSDLILDGGQCIIGIESTIVECVGSTPIILRPGTVTDLMVEKTTGLTIGTSKKTESLVVSGMLDKHYSPRAKVKLNTNTNPGEGFIALFDIPTPEGAIRLGSPEDIESFARQIYSLLRLGDARDLASISIILPSVGGISDAIKDRLSKAAAS